MPGLSVDSGAIVGLEGGLAPHAASTKAKRLKFLRVKLLGNQEKKLTCSSLRRVQQRQAIQEMLRRMNNGFHASPVPSAN
jgi:hypothetical protein